MVSATLASFRIRGVDVIVGTSPQLFTACAAWMVGALKRRPYIFELRDLWPESIKAVGAMKESAAIRWLEKLELFLYRKAARVVSVTHSFRRVLVGRGIDPGKIDVVTNGVDISRFSPRPKDAALVQELGMTGKFVAGYIGTHGMAHALETVLEAARKLKEHPDGHRFRFILLGDGAQKADLIARAGQLALDNVVFVDTVPKNQVARYWSLLDVSIIHLRRAELFNTVIPSKLFECMGMGIPVLHGVAGESAEIVQREGVGVLFEPENADELVTGLLRLEADRALWQACHERGLAAARTYDRSALAAVMLRIVESVRSTRQVL
jgi:glycosyltransferase involved in cell wall biosynthesis